MGPPVISPETPDVPGGVYLCQASPTASCGACCGLYNVAKPSRRYLAGILAFRTETFAGVRRDEDGIYAFQRMIERRERQRRPFPNFHHCPFMGLVGAERARVGCLLHPEAAGNEGVDFRGLSWYGGLACRTFFCASYRKLPARFKQIVIDLSADWYLYGLIVTEVSLLAGFFSAIEERLGGPLLPEMVHTQPERQRALRAFFNLKTAWPFRGQASPGPANYFFEDGQYPTAPVRYPGPGREKSEFDDIFQALGSAFESPRALQAAEARIEALLAPFRSPFVPVFSGIGLRRP